MRLLPPKSRRPATRRHYAQCIARVLGLSVYPPADRQGEPAADGVSAQGRQAA
jgi:hypothetical protein